MLLEKVFDANFGNIANFVLIAIVSVVIVEVTVK